MVSLCVRIYIYTYVCIHMPHLFNCWRQYSTLWFHILHALLPTLLFLPSRSHAGLAELKSSTSKTCRPGSEAKIPQTLSTIMLRPAGGVLPSLDAGSGLAPVSQQGSYSFTPILSQQEQVATTAADCCCHGRIWLVLLARAPQSVQERASGDFFMPVRLYNC